jgi:3-deoxy-D-manno-octulosonic-acid transferase
MNTVRQIQNAFIEILYWACRVVAFPLLVFYFVYRCARDPGYLRRFAERLGAGPGSFQATPPGSIWLHAVSVGEAISAAGLIAELRKRSPGIPLYVSVGTVAGRAVAREKLSPMVDGIFYAPIDYAFAVRRVLRRIRPAAVVILETEIWPVLYREVKRAGCALLIVNGRISDRAFPAYRRWRFFFRIALRRPDSIMTQSEQDRGRYIQAGAPEERVRALGNLKYDSAPVRAEPPRVIRSALSELLPSAVWIAASTMPPADAGDPDEDDVVLNAFAELAQSHPRLLLILAPRRPERFDDVAQRLRAAGIRYVRRSRNGLKPDLALPCVVLLDSIGELAGLFPVADVVFMGGTLARRGGHNLLEPAACGRAIVTGPHLENFAAIAAEFREHRAVLEISSAAELAGAVRELIDHPEERDALGARAAELAARHRGVTAAAAAEILKWHDQVVPSGKPRGMAMPLLWFLAQLWTVAGKIGQRRDVAHARRLQTPVVSVGGISMGGAGKTPMVEYLTDRMHERGRQPAILTRGYRRRSIEPTIVIEAGEHVPVSLTGDETQIYVRAGHAHAGIGANRWSTGRMVEEIHHPDIFFLDDGFQHRRLRRDLDLVLIDALNPFAGHAVFPLGRLREPVAALARADALLLMRAACEREYAGLCRELRSLNPRAPIFRARFEPRYWVNHRTGRPAHPPERRAAAFCGLGNPASFWGSLKGLGIQPVFTWAFGDHHSYSCTELHRLAAQARMYGTSVLLCTEKDAMNLPERATELLLNESAELYWLKIGVHVEEEDELLALIESKVSVKSF